jgi:coenzyme F420-reducing hydrogenase gamma subunit
VVKVDAQVPGCPMDPKVFLAAVDKLVAQFRGPKA